MFKLLVLSEQKNPVKQDTNIKIVTKINNVLFRAKNLFSLSKK